MATVSTADWRSPGVHGGVPGTCTGMTDTAALQTLSDAVDRIDPAFAHQAVSWLSVGLGGLAVVAPRRSAGLFGVTSADSAVPLLVRMIGVRNAVAGLRTLQAQGDDLQRALRAGLVLGAVDATAVVLAARRGAMSRSSAVGALLVLGGIAVLGVAASRD
jgi:hypothetical protein